MRKAIPTLVAELVSVIACARHRKAGGSEEPFNCRHGLDLWRFVDI